ncbi:MAG: molybdenum cofactor guanylyltransferase [Crocinitomicaceae bacterium]
MSFSGIILAGGRSSRMGEDKALLQIDGKPMIQHVSDVLRELCDEVIIASSNEKHAQYGDLMVKDSAKDIGPLAGIQAGLLAAKNERSFVLSCDTPFVTKEILEALAEHFEGEQITLPSSQGRLQPLIAIYGKEVLTTIASNLERNEHSLMQLQKICSAKVIHFDESESKAFENINTPSEWKQWNEK